MNFVCLVFELGDKTLTLSPMENLMVKCNLPIDASYKIWLWLAKRFQRRRSLKLWTDGRYAISETRLKLKDKTTHL